MRGLSKGDDMRRGLRRTIIGGATALLLTVSVSACGDDADESGASESSSSTSASSSEPSSSSTEDTSSTSTASSSSTSEATTEPGETSSSTSSSPDDAASSDAPPIEEWTIDTAIGTYGPLTTGMTAEQIEGEEGYDLEVTTEETGIGPIDMVTAPTEGGGEHLVGAIVDDGGLTYIFPLESAQLDDLGVGDPLSDFEEEYGSLYSEEEGAPMVTIGAGVKVQVFNEVSATDPDTSNTLILCAPGAGPFYEFA